ncbi:heterodisulfide reductase-related iron-sulfur binding cluster [Afifella aestuarii]|uniref:heterodisulfide reductase-related iron-sulfur binding cluster n=1 Tax=Afifella aestuarii TaxID=1909496 RepID=UPI000FE2A509|nr:heterodisulfide reductase-related iron-sulfur binding cluster [Afifella aestuarii]
MQTSFTLQQLADPRIEEADAILRKCVHCGFCLATCPTYVELGNELDSPRGRIYLIKDMLEAEKPATAEVALHIDRCLSCFSCMTTCPSGVDYMHLLDQGRRHIEETYRRPWHDRALRAVLAHVMPYPARMRAALVTARYGRPLAPLLARMGRPFDRLAMMLRLAPKRLPAKIQASETGHAFPANGARKGRVALLTGCAQSVLDPGINAATIRLLTRLGIEVVLPKGEGCCGGLVHHMGQDEKALPMARANIDAWLKEIDGEGLDAILVTTSGCGTTIKDYAHLLKGEPAYREKAERASSLALDISEYLARLDLPAPRRRTGLKVAYHAACSLQHGQKVVKEPRTLLAEAGFEVLGIPEGHLCCGSAGTYNILEPEIAARLRDRKAANIESVAPEVVATGNIGCITQIGSAMEIPVLHTVELLDWAHGGPPPEAFAGHALEPTRSKAASSSERPLAVS